MFFFFQMDSNDLKRIADEERLGCPVNLLSDVGSYCYTALTSVALNMLYSEEGKTYDK